MLCERYVRRRRFRAQQLYFPLMRSVRTQRERTLERSSRYHWMRRRLRRLRLFQLRTHQRAATFSTIACATIRTGRGASTVLRAGAKSLVTTLTRGSHAALPQCRSTIATSATKETSVAWRSLNQLRERSKSWLFGTAGVKLCLVTLSLARASTTNDSQWMQSFRA